jgi:hypothetical protein
VVPFLGFMAIGIGWYTVNNYICNCLRARNDTMNGTIHVNYITNHVPRSLQTGKS